MATLTVADIAATGQTATLATPGASGDEFANPSDGRTFLMVTNDSTNARTVTITPPSTAVTVPGSGALTVPTLAVTVTGAAVTKFIGPFPSALYNNTNNRVAVTYSSTSNLTVGAFRVPSLG